MICFPTVPQHIVTHDGLSSIQGSEHRTLLPGYINIFTSLFQKPEYFHSFTVRFFSLTCFTQHKVKQNLDHSALPS